MNEREPDKKLILYLGGFELPDKNAAAHRVLSNAELFRKLGYEVSLIGVEKIKSIQNGVLFRKEIIKGFKTFIIKYPERKIEWYRYGININSVLKIIEEELKTKPFALIAYDYPSVALLKLQIYCKKREILIIGDCAEWYSAYGNLCFWLVKSLDTAMRMRWVHTRLDGVITISKYLYEFYHKQIGNVILLPPLIDKSDEKWKGVHYEENSVCRLVYAGSPGNGKKDRIDTILVCLAKIRDQIKPFFLTIIGITYEQYLIDFNKKSIPDNIRDNVVFKGLLTHAETINEIKLADYSIFIRQPNRVTKAGFPTKFVESLACGTPVITNNSSNIKDYLFEENVGYLLDDKNIEALNNSLIYILNQPKEKLKLMKNRCKQYFMFDYNMFLNETSNFMGKIKR